MVHVFSEVIRYCNKFDGDITRLWEFWFLNNSRPVGYMPVEYVRSLDWTGTAFEISEENRVVHLNPKIRPGEDMVQVCISHFVLVCQNNKDKFWGSLGLWLTRPPDYHGIRWLDDSLDGFKIPAPLRGVFGIVTAGVHLNVYTVIDEVGAQKKHLWVSRRSAAVTFPGTYDQIAAGSMDMEDGYDPLLSLRREAWEEAGLTFDIDTKTMSRNGTVIGTVTGPYRVSFYDIKDELAGTEEGHLEPGVRCVFDLRVEPEFIPAVNSAEAIDHFELKPIEEVEADLIVGAWKPSSALATLDFLVRTGFVAAKFAGSLEGVAKSLQRELPLRCT